MVKKGPLTDFDTGVCLRFPRQGQFNPLKYLADCTNILQSVLTSMVSSPGIPQKRPGIARVTVRGLIHRDR
ncbi:MAG: hypothetical protein V7K74_19095 [Nostoc sp.]